MQLILNLMDSHKNYQESKVKGTGIGIFPTWLSNLSNFGVAGPGIAVAGAAAAILSLKNATKGLFGRLKRSQRD